MNHAMGVCVGKRKFIGVFLPAFAFLCLAPISHALACSGISISVPNFLSISLTTGNCGIAGALCMVVGWFTGTLGKAIASLSVVFLGIQAFFGKVTWGTALLYAVGIFSIFGAADIVEAFTGTNADVCGMQLSVGLSF